MENEEYFLVQAQLDINAHLLESSDLVPSSIEFENEIPAPFKMVNEIVNIDAQAFRGLQLNSSVSATLLHYLKAQNQKINCLLGYVLSSQDDPQFRFSSDAFSAGKLLFTTEDEFPLGANVKLKIFLPEGIAAVYCYAKVTCLKKSQVELTYTQIREEDQELLIRLTLHVQSRELKLRAEKRNLAENNE